MRNLNILRKALFIALALTLSIFQSANIAAALVDLRGSTPEEASITLSASKPANAGDAIITLATYDADFPDEGELIINGNPPVQLFGTAGVGGNDQNSASIDFRTPASYWRNGANTLLFRHTRTQGYIVDAVTVFFEPAPVSNTPSPTATPPVAPNIVAAYTFDERTGQTLADSSGNDNQGIITGATWTTGQYDDALLFDGSNDSVDLGGLDVAGSALSVTTWIRKDACGGGSDCRIISKAVSSEEQGHYIMMSLINGNQLRFRLKTNGVTHTLIGGSLSDNVWTHVAAIYDGSTMKLFVDGVEAASAAKTGALTTNASVPMWIGANPTDGYGVWNGAIDNLRIYSRALSVSEVQADRDTPVNGTPPTYECSDGIDNDADGDTDYPADTGCSSATDNDESDTTPPTPPAFPVDLRGNTPEEASITLSASKPENAGDAVITLATYDADFPDEGELIINDNPPVQLFGTAGVSGNDQNSADIDLSTPASYWRNGDNTLLFRHTSTQGYVIDAATVSFESSQSGDTTPPPTATLTASPSTINEGDSSTLTWSSTNATTCTDTGFSSGGATGGSVSVSPTATTTYSVTCTTGAGGSANDSATVSVIPSTSPACSDGVDNDADTLTDYPDDPGCDSLTDDDETDESATGSEFPVDLRGSTPEEASITLNTTKPAGASNGVITLTTYDADFSNEGELIINDNPPVQLFGTAGVSGNDQNSADIDLSTPASYWRNGDNTLLFRHTSTQGYVIDAATVSFDDAAPQTGTGSVSLSWTPPVARADGSALAMSEIAGYTVRYGTSAGNYPNSQSVNGGSSTSTTINNLPVDTTYYMVVTTQDTDGRDSAPSNMASKLIK